MCNLLHNGPARLQRFLLGCLIWSHCNVRSQEDIEMNKEKICEVVCRLYRRDSVGLHSLWRLCERLWNLISLSKTLLFFHVADFNSAAEKICGVVHCVNYTMDFPFKWMGHGIKSDFKAEFPEQNTLPIPFHLNIPLHMDCTPLSFLSLQCPWIFVYKICHFWWQEQRCM